MVHAEGRMLAHYRLVDKLGEGGMGVVWKAIDTRLERPVALKTLRAAFVDDPQRVARFEREARTVAALNHPNVITIFSVEEANGIRFLTMELVEGKTLAQLIPDAGLPCDRLVELMLTLTDAVSAAHERGVIHRDLKPANVMLDDRGLLKVLDFGLAKLRKRPVAHDDRTATITLTQEQHLLGTLAYMSPEQLQGQPGNHLSDVFALGVMLYEMATGSRPFQGPSPTVVISAILDGAIANIDSIRPDLPSQLTAITARCLEKQPQRRFQTVRDLHREIAGLRTAMPVSGPTATSRVPSIAVLPFENLSRDPAQEYVADGMTEALIIDLARIGGLKVISRTSVMGYKGVKKPLPQIAGELGVETVLEGSVLCVGDRVRITAQLLKAMTDEHLWANRYDRDLRDVLDLQSEVAQAIVGAINVKLTPGERRRLGKTRQVDPEVYLLVLRGRQLWNLRTEESFRKALEYYRQATERDPTFAPAWAGLADCHNMLVNYGFIPVREGTPRAQAALARALELDPEMGQAYRVQAQIRWQCEFDWEGAEASYLRALELDPGAALTRWFYGVFLGVWGRFDEGIDELRRAQEMDPLSLNITCLIGWVHYFARRFHEAEPYYRRVLEVDSSSLLAHWFLGQVLIELERFDEGVEWLEKTLTLSGGAPRFLGYLGYAYARAGRVDDAKRMLNELSSRAQRGYVPPYFAALVHSGLGDRDRAFEELERAAALPDTMIRDIKIDPPLEGLRSDPRYDDLLRRLGLATR